MNKQMIRQRRSIGHSRGILCSLLASVGVSLVGRCGATGVYSSPNPASAVETHITAKILEPDGLPVQQIVKGEDTYTRADPACFEWQYVHANNEVVAYHATQPIRGLVDPIPPASYNWSVSAGTLNGATTATPTYVPNNMNVPESLTMVDLELRPISGSDDHLQRRTLEVYRDHLERDYQNFAAAGSYGDPIDPSWKFKRYGISVTVPSTWNCFGSVWHSYDGTHGGSATDVPSSDFVADPPVYYPGASGPSWATALAGLKRGDIVVFLHNDHPQHAHTCLGSANAMFGANNAPGLVWWTGKDHGATLAAKWRWAVCSVQEYYEQSNTCYHQYYPNSDGDDLLNNIVVLRRK